MIIGKDIHVEYSEYNGKPYVMIRRFYEADGEMKPGKQGINMKLEEWEEFLKNIDKIGDEVRDSASRM
jgi:hypothetical protein